jgi:hypothetical protein
MYHLDATYSTFEEGLRGTEQGIRDRSWGGVEHGHGYESGRESGQHGPAGRVWGDGRGLWVRRDVDGCNARCFGGRSLPVLRLLRGIRDAYELRDELVCYAETRTVLWMPLYHVVAHSRCKSRPCLIKACTPLFKFALPTIPPCNLALSAITSAIRSSGRRVMYSICGQQSRLPSLNDYYKFNGSSPPCCPVIELRSLEILET